MSNPQVGIIMGSRSDLDVMSEAAEVLELLGVAIEVTIVSAHRTPNRMIEYAEKAKARGLKVIIAGGRRGGSPSRYGCRYNYLTRYWRPS